MAKNDQQAAAIKAIETTYNGHRFRSRLEARWAVFMDCLGVPYVYEPEGYEDGVTRYLPDFFLPSLDIWMEVKPTREIALSRQSIQKATMLARGTSKSVLIAAGECAIQSRTEPRSWGFLLNRNGELRQGNENEPLSFKFHACLFCQAVSLWGLSCCECVCLMDNENSPLIQAAFLIARRIRFDHEACRHLTAQQMHATWLHVWTEAINFARLDYSTQIESEIRRIEYREDEE